MKLKHIPVLAFAFTMIFAMAFGTLNAAADEPAARPQLTIGRFKSAPKIDGKFSESEWGTKSFTLAEGQPNVTAHKQKSGDKELPLTKTVSDVYLGYDDTHLYLCVVADYPKHSAQALLGSKLWADDCLQTKIAATPDGPNYNDIDFGLNTTTNRALAHVWNGHGVTYDKLSPGNGKDFMITREGTKTVYEIAYPLQSFASNVLRLKEGDKVAFSIAQHMSDNGGFYEFAGGIVNSKEITSAGILVLGAAKNLPSSGNNNNNNTASKPGNTTSNKNNTTSKNNTASNNQNNESTVSDNTDSTESGDVSTVINSDGEEVVVVEEVVEDDSDNNGSIPKGWVIGIIGGMVVILGVAFYFLILRKR